MGRWLLQKWGGGYTNLSTREKEVYRVTKGHEGVVIHFYRWQDGLQLPKVRWFIIIKS